MQDAAIVELYWQRSDRAIRETDRKYGRYCHTIAYNICRSREDAEECVNDTWLGAWNAMPDARPSVLSAFLGAITRNLALDRFRRQNRAKRGGGETALALEEMDECVLAGTDVEREIEGRELARAVDAFLAALPETDRRVFTARYWFLVPIREIAAKSGCSEGKIKMQLSRLRRRLRTELEEEGLY